MQKLIIWINNKKLNSGLQNRERESLASNSTFTAIQTGLVREVEVSIGYLGIWRGEVLLALASTSLVAVMAG